MFGSTVPGGTVNCGETLPPTGTVALETVRHFPVFLSLTTVPTSICCALGKKLFNDATPCTTGPSATGICWGARLPKCCRPSTLKLCSGVWKALSTAAADPEKRISMPSGETDFTTRPCDASHCLTLLISADAGPNMVPICCGVSQW